MRRLRATWRTGRVATRAGPVRVAWTHAGITFAVEDAPGALAEISRRTGCTLVAAAVPSLIKRAITSAAAGRITDAPIDLTWARDYERDVLLAAREVPRGATRSYSWLARRARRPLAVRAAASVIARNPLWRLVPCHRIIYKDGTLGPYGDDGAARKRALLAREGVRL